MMRQSEVKWKAISLTLLLDEQFNELWSVEVRTGKYKAEPRRAKEYTERFLTAWKDDNMKIIEF